jgi:anti-sigma regulatory factor (Ser/Thr protein kinase)
VTERVGDHAPAGPLVGEALVLDPTASAVSGARGHVRRVLREHGADELEETAELAVSELATNAVLHARTPFTVAVRRTPSGRVRVEVADVSPAPVQLRRFGVSATTGRGLALVASVSHDWGVEVAERAGKTVWFEPRPAGPADDGSADDRSAGVDPAWAADVEELLRA